MLVRDVTPCSDEYHAVILAVAAAAAACLPAAACGPGFDAPELASFARGPDLIASESARCSGVNSASGINLKRRLSAAPVSYLGWLMFIPRLAKYET